MMNSPIIAAHSVTKTYQAGEIEVHALNGVDLAIEKGQMVAVMGPSGSGKTTLLNIFSGIDDATSGQVIIDGVSIHGMSDGDRTTYRALNMGFVFQSYNLLPVLTGAENVEWWIVELDRCQTDMMEEVVKSYDFLTTRNYDRGK